MPRYGAPEPPPCDDPPSRVLSPPLSVSSTRIPARTRASNVRLNGIVAGLPTAQPCRDVLAGGLEPEIGELGGTAAGRRQPRPGRPRSTALRSGADALRSGKCVPGRRRRRGAMPRTVRSPRRVARRCRECRLRTAWSSAAATCVHQLGGGEEGVLDRPEADGRRIVSLLQLPGGCAPGGSRRAPRSLRRLRRRALGSRA